MVLSRLLLVGDFTFFLDPVAGFFQDYEELRINNQTHAS
jgi:hypothetical protein